MFLLQFKRSVLARVVSFCKPVEYVPIEFRRIMLAIIIDRVRDSAPTVRSKALAALADVVSNRTSPTVHSLVCAVFLDPYKSQPEIDFSARERDFVKWANFVAAFDEVCLTILSGFAFSLRDSSCSCNQHYEGCFSKSNINTLTFYIGNGKSVKMDLNL